MFEHPFFWRHFAAFAGGFACIGTGTLGAAIFPALVPFAGSIIGAGAGLLALAGTSVLEPDRMKGNPTP